MRADERSAHRRPSGMRIGALLTLSHPPEWSAVDGQQWDVREIRRLDRVGFDEVWIGEHFTAPWEPCPSPDLLIAEALLLSKRIRLSPLGHLLPDMREAARAPCNPRVPRRQP
jgi:alkanesulfonate monooxygenase SsuD/methylene tetrahydromethanopterin reductase-like flavin-dependent oxidoreductase (luciferase family)